MSGGKVFFGQIVHCLGLNRLEIFAKGFVAVENGKILKVGKLDDFEKWLNPANSKFEQIQLKPSQFLLPGLIDCHIHASQMPNQGLGLDRPLMEWLETYTFPLESQYGDKAFAQQVYAKVVRNCLNVGTTCAVYFATLHCESSKILVDEAIKQGQRAFVGKVTMHQNSPDFYCESREKSLSSLTEFISYVHDQQSDLVRPIITPRFAVTCDTPLMLELAKIAQSQDLHIQSHISENLSEIDFVRTLFPASQNYADVYRTANLLTPKTIMAHCVHLEEQELDVFQETGTAAIHCPISNTNLKSGLCDVKRLIGRGVKVGLGTDVSGGNKLGMLDVMRHTLDVSMHLGIMKSQEIQGCGRLEGSKEDGGTYEPLNYKQVLFFATLGGAEALSMQDKIGNFASGKDFDALVVETDAFPIINYERPAALEKNKTPEQRLEELIQRFVYVGDDRNIVQVYVQGRKVK